MESHLKVAEKILRHLKKIGTWSYSVHEETFSFGVRGDADYVGYRVDWNVTSRVACVIGWYLTLGKKRQDLVSLSSNEANNITSTTWRV